MKKLIFFILFLSVCSIGVYAYFYWKAMQVKTPLVSVDITIPKRETLKRVQVPKENISSKKLEQKSAQSKNVDKKTQTGQGVVLEKRENPVLVEIKEQVSAQKQNESEKTQEMVQDELPSEIIKTQVQETKEAEDKGDVLQKEAPAEENKIIAEEKTEEAVPLLIPTTESIIKEETSPVISQ